MFGSVIPEQLVEFFEAPGFLSNSVVFAEVVFLNFAFVEADSMFSRAQCQNSRHMGVDLLLYYSHWKDM
jgi:hypothetical protein